MAAAGPVAGFTTDTRLHHGPARDGIARGVAAQAGFGRIDAAPGSTGEDLVGRAEHVFILPAERCDHDEVAPERDAGSAGAADHGECFAGFMRRQPELVRGLLGVAQDRQRLVMAGGLPAADELGIAFGVARQARGGACIPARRLPGAVARRARGECRRHASGDDGVIQARLHRMAGDR